MHNTTTHFFVILICSSIGAITTIAAPNSTRFIHDIEIPTLQQEEIVAVTLDPFIWDQATTAKPVIYIWDQADRRIPYRMQKSAAFRYHMSRKRVSANIAGLREQPDNQIELLVVLDAKAPTPNLLELVTPLKNFERQISVAGIDTDGNEHLLVTDALVYDYSRFADVRANTIALPENAYREFRIRINAATDEHPILQRNIQRALVEQTESSRTEAFTLTDRPFRIDAVNLYRETQTQTQRSEREAPITVKSWTTEIDTRNQQTIITLETHNTPLSGLRLETPEPNFARTATVQIPRLDAGRQRWHNIGQAQLTRVSFRGASTESLKIPFPVQQARHLRIVIENRDNQPLEINNVQGLGPIWQAAFIAQPEHQYRLFHGHDSATPPRYDTAPLERLMASGITPRDVALSPPTRNPDFIPDTSWSARLPNSKILFLAGIVSMTAVLGWGLYRAAQGIPTSNN